MSEFKGKGGAKGRGFGGGKRDGGFKPRGPRRDGGEGYKPRREDGEGGFSRGPRREGGYKPRAPRAEGEDGGYRPRREGGFKPRGEGGYSRGPRREGEGGGFRGRSDGGYKPRAPRGEGEEGGYRPRREGGFKPRGEGGYSRGPRREGGYKPRSEGGFSRNPRRDERSFEPRDEQQQQAPRGKSAHWVEKDPYATAPGSDGWLVGKHAVEGAIRAGRRVVKEVWLAGDADDIAAFQAKFPEAKVKTVRRGELDERFEGQVHQGIAAEVGNLPQPALDEVLASAPRLLVGLDQVTDPHNFGAVLRSCAAFGVGGVIATERRSAGVTSVVAKAAAGALEIVPVLEVTNLATALGKVREAGYTVIGLAGEATQSLAEITLPADAKLCLVLGSEGEGLRRLTRENCDHLVRIPMSDAMESLNVSVAAGVMLSGLYK
ncbi:MAG: 23S rRNA (guanosine(2251)-2'-O)-methyltransferase RlmB [Pseudomonadaceae bacterium]|nr:23S rRNA (guanosine(2251)-2'-O)-methyltransferase RlmB [Pseudomonadaceae bacterium]